MDVLIWDIIPNITTFKEIQETEYNLNISRFVDIFIEEPEVDIAAVQKAIER